MSKRGIIARNHYSYHYQYIRSCVIRAIWCRARTTKNVRKFLTKIVSSVMIIVTNLIVYSLVFVNSIPKEVPKLDFRDSPDISELCRRYICDMIDERHVPRAMIQIFYSIGKNRARLCARGIPESPFLRWNPPTKMILENVTPDIGRNNRLTFNRLHEI